MCMCVTVYICVFVSMSMCNCKHSLPVSVSMCWTVWSVWFYTWKSSHVDCVTDCVFVSIRKCDCDRVLQATLVCRPVCQASSEPKWKTSEKARAVMYCRPFSPFLASRIPLCVLVSMNYIEPLKHVCFRVHASIKRLNIITTARSVEFFLPCWVELSAYKSNREA